MHTKTNIFWDDNDPYPMAKRIDEAFNRVISFCPELMNERCASGGPLRPQELISFNRIVGGDFDPNDIIVLVRYAGVVHLRIIAKYVPMVDTRCCKEQRVLAEDILQAAKNLVTIMNETSTYVRDRICH